MIYFIKSFQIENINTICNIKITGKPIENLNFLVLCLKVYIPVIAPMLPPIRASINKDCSGILHFPYLAFLLSIYIVKKATKLITIRYIIKNDTTLQSRLTGENALGMGILLKNDNKKAYDIVITVNGYSRSVNQHKNSYNKELL